jgi:DNA-binding response OmpR family regulator
MRLLVAAHDGASLGDRLASAGAEIVRVVERAPEIGLAMRTDAIDVVVATPDVVDASELARLVSQPWTCAFLGWLGEVSTATASDLLEAGADDVLHAGMGELELRARLRLAVARSGRHSLDETIEFAGLQIDEAHGEATWNGHDLHLTGRERQVLGALVAAGGRPVRREAIYRRVWGFTMARGDRSVDVNVKRLRSKLAAAGSDVSVKTQPGVGYRLEPAEVSAGEPVTAS